MQRGGGISANNGNGDVPIHLTQEVTQFSVTVPTVLPVDVSATGVVTVANENKIINNSFGPVEVKSVSVESLGDWTLVDFDTDFKSKKVGLHEYGFQMNNTNVQPNGSCAAVFEVIPGNGQISFVYDSKIATQNTALTDEQIANVVFTIGWAQFIDLEYWRNWNVAEENPGYDRYSYYKDKGYNIELKNNYAYFRKTNEPLQLEKIYIPHTVAQGGTGYRTVVDVEAFANNPYVKFLYIGTSTHSLEINRQAFSNCDNLETVIIDAAVHPGWVRDISIAADAFSGCEKLKTIIIRYADGTPSFNQRYGNPPFGAPNMTAEDVIYLDIYP